MIQCQFLNKVLKTGDVSPIILNNFTEDYFSDYPQEYRWIKDHYDKYGTCPDIHSFVDKFPDFDFGRNFVQRLFADEIRTGTGEHSFGVVRVPQKQGVPHHTIQNGVTQKLQTFIVFGRKTAVRHGARQERLILKVIVDPFFQNRQIHQTLSGHTVT